MEKLTEEQLIQEKTSQFLFSKRYLDPIHERMNEQEELYRTYIDPSNYPHSARVFDPRIFRVIETITPRLVANEPEGSFYPVEDGDIVTSQILNSLIKYDWKRADMFPKLVKFVKSMLIFGTAFGRVYYDFRETERTRMVPREVAGKMIWDPVDNEKITVTEYDGPNFEPLNIYDCFPDPNATGIENMRWFIYRTFKTLDELKQMNEAKQGSMFKNLDKLEELIKSKKEEKANDSSNSGASPNYMQFREHRRTMLSTSELTGQDSSNPEVVVLRCYTRERWVDIVPEYSLVIRDVENPYFNNELPIVCGVDYPYPGELYGMGEIEPIDRIQRAINAVLNQRLDNVQLIIKNMWKVKKGAGVNMSALVSTPGNVIEMDDLTALEPITIPDATGVTFVQTMNYLTSALQNGSGITDYTIGLNNDANVANKTATGTRLIQQEANAQFKLKLQLFYHMVVSPIANKFKDLRIQYTTEEQKLRIIGKSEIDQLRKDTKLSQIDMFGQEILPGELDRTSKLQIAQNGSFAFLNLMPEDIQPAIVGDYDFIPVISSETLMDPIVMQDNFFLALDRVSNPNWTNGLATQRKQLNYESLTKKVFDKLNLGIESSDVLTDVQAQPVDAQGMPQASGPMKEEELNQMLEPTPNPMMQNTPDNLEQFNSMGGTSNE